MELFEQIRRELEFGVGTIAGVSRKLGVHRRMVLEALRSAEPAASKPQRRRLRKLVDASAFIDRILTEDRQAPVKQRHTARRIWQRLCAELPGFTAWVFGNPLPLATAGRLPASLPAPHLRRMESLGNGGQRLRSPAARVHAAGAPTRGPTELFSQLPSQHLLGQRAHDGSHLDRHVEGSPPGPGAVEMRVAMAYARSGLSTSTIQKPARNSFDSAKTPSVTGAPFFPARTSRA